MAGLPPFPPNPLGMAQVPLAGGMPFPELPHPPLQAPVANNLAAPNAGQLPREEVPRTGLSMCTRLHADYDSFRRWRA